MRFGTLARRAGWVSFWLVMTLIAVGLLALGYRAYRQSAIAAAMTIKTPNGIDEARFVRVGGIDQWVTIRGNDRDNPVLLYLMGGPGDTIIPRAYGLYRRWEDTFTVVQWDQRGAGRTYTRNGEAGSAQLSIDRAVRDGIELAEFLRDHLEKQKIVLFGVSWGSILGVRMVKERPDLFCAYVSSGQFVSARAGEELAYAALVTKARSAKDTAALEQLAHIGPQFYTDLQKVRIERKWLHKYLSPPSEASFRSASLKAMFVSPGYSLREYVSFDSGTMFSLRELWPQILQTDLRALGSEFHVPVFIFQGAEDFQTPTALARAYFDFLSAPKKEMVLIDGGGHLVALVMPDRILQELNTRVRPIANETRVP